MKRSVSALDNYSAAIDRQRILSFSKGRCCQNLTSPEILSEEEHQLN
ncbi:hypothetical protein H6G17_10710 [Chroococcidiopsis sp. FACHB-1243]|nr:hypothetical protein [Chroococcidiopsis sp. [FACHB-1243]]MBD2305982.1 hypothetical protein [Chroococcidiopsis sp. [FACHB-1243]]